jgi:hypothetical protein
MKRHRQIIVATYASIESLSLLWISLYFLYVTKDWRYWYYMITVVHICIIAGVVWLPESPDFYYAKGRFRESIDVLMIIARFNGRTVSREQFNFESKKTES